jgi:hypothetical protein
MGKRGSMGAQPPGGGLGGCSPHETLKGGEQPTPATLPRVGPKTPANPKPTGVGKWGSRGAKPPWRGAWGVSPHETLKRGELPALATLPRVGPETLASPQLTRVGNGGGGGGAPSQGAWGMCPQNFQRRGEQPTFATPPRVGPKTPANPKPTRVGKRGSRGRSPRQRRKRVLPVT